VPGFGKKTVDKLRADLTVNGGAAPSRAEGKAKPAARKDGDPAKVAKKDVSKNASDRK
jgi:competence protein ComEA